MGTQGDSPTGTATSISPWVGAVLHLQCTVSALVEAQGLLWPSNKSGGASVLMGGEKLNVFFTAVKSLVQFSMWSRELYLPSYRHQENIQQLRLPVVESGFSYSAIQYTLGLCLLESK